MKRTTVFVMIISAFLTLIFLAACSKSLTPDQIKAMMTISDVETKWISKYYQPWPPRLQLVPRISLRVKNTSDKPLTHVFFNALFKEKGAQENIGDNFRAAIGDKPVLPGEYSEVITLQSQYGVDGKNLESIKSHPLWKVWSVKLYVQTRGSAPILMGEWDISRDIDFKEPAPANTEPAKPKTEEKKDLKKDAVKVIK